MDTAFIAITLSVLMHVAWNLLARHVEARCNFLWWGLLAHLILLGPWALWCLLVDSLWNTTLIVALIVSATANTFYFISLRKAYHYAPVALVYPLVRSSPVLIMFWAWLVFDQQVSLGGIVGICISAVGLWFLAGTSRKGDTRQAIPWAIMAAVATSIYSLSDKMAVTYLPTFGAQLGFITIGYLSSFIGLSVVQYRENHIFIPACRPQYFYIITGGIFIGLAYALVVRAMHDLPAAYVVAYTNTGIVLATILSIWMFKEKEKWRKRLSAAIIVALGLIVLGIEQ